MDREEIQLRAQALVDEMVDEYKKLDIAQEAFEQVVERTQNFREGWFSIRRISELQRAHAKRIMLTPMIVMPAEQLFSKISETTQNLRNITATLMREIERLDS